MENAYCYGKRYCENIMNMYKPDNICPNPGMFTYHHGVLLSGMEALYKFTGDEKYFDYIKAWVDSLVDEIGTIKPIDNRWCSLDTLDYRQPGILMFNLYRKTGDERYKKVLEYLTESLVDFPVNSKGVFWHMTYTPNEVWVDGLYMASPLMAMYADAFSKPEFFDKAAKQVIGMYYNMRDDNGLLRHGWDETKQIEWADKNTGLSSEVWGRAMGWFVVATVDILDYLPQNHIEREHITEIFAKMINSIEKYQGKDGRWYQVIDKVEKEGNWYENSCTSMFLYAIAKGIRLGYLNENHIGVLEKGFEGIINSTYEENGNLILPDICAGTCIDEGDYQHYINRPVVKNDLHGGIFTKMCIEVNLLFDKR